MELLSYYRSSAAYRVRIALNYKAIDHTLTPVNIFAGEHRQAEYKSINPQGLVPVLRTDDGHVISQTVAIIEYLEIEFPNKPLLPSSSIAAARVRSWVNSIACDIHPLNNLRVLKYLSDNLDVSEVDKTSWYHHWLKLGFAALESQISAAPYCDGAQISLADVYLIPQVYNAHRFELNMQAFPKIQSVYEACNKLPAFQAATPENQIDAT